MTFEIGLVLVVLVASLVLFVTEALRMDVVALSVLALLALTGLVSPTEALAGFSNPAVVTVWAMFILSAGLTRAGVAEMIGRAVLRSAGRGEAWTIAVIASSSAILSAFMNNIGVAALMLPAVVSVARRAGFAPSKLLMPLAYGTLLGGLTTLVGTPPNLLVSDALRAHGLEPFGMFDYTPVGIAVLVAGIAFLAIFARRILPSRDPGREAAGRGGAALAREYRLGERAAVLEVPPDSPLAGKSLRDSRLGSAAGLNVFALQRGEALELAPSPEEVLRVSDRLLVEGRLDRFEELRGWSALVVRDDDQEVEEAASREVGLLECVVRPGASIVGLTLGRLDFRARFGVIVLALERDGERVERDLAHVELREGDRLLVQGARSDIARLSGSGELETTRPASTPELARRYALRERLFCLEVPSGSALDGATLVESRLGDALGVGVLAIVRDETRRVVVPGPAERLRGGDLLLVRGRRQDVEAFRGLQGLRVETEPTADWSTIEDGDVGVTEVALSPRASVVGRTPAELGFRERYGVQLLAILRRGAVRRSELARVELALGDALLLLGPRARLAAIAADPDFLPMAGDIVPAPEPRRAPLAAAIMASVVVPVLFGWLPISIASVAGACAMVLTGCLSMDAAYRAIEWRSIFLIAGMLPLGTALGETGAAAWIAEGIVRSAEPVGPWAVVVALYAVTALATSIVPTAALVVLMAPIALTACASTGLSPYAVMMAIAMAASASFTSPISHPANVLVMGPGGYRFADYVKVGIPLTVVVMAVVFGVLPFVWPLV